MRRLEVNISMSNRLCTCVNCADYYRFAVGRVPIVVARHPRQVTRERCDKEAQTPRNYDIVEEIHVECDQNDSVTNSFGVG